MFCLSRSLLALLTAGVALVSQASAHTVDKGFAYKPTKEEKQTVQAFEQVKTNPAKLFNFLKTFPKGGDLHNHLFGAIYAEDYLQWAAEDHLCVSVSKHTVLTKKCSVTSDQNGKDIVSAQYVLSHPDLRNQMIDAFSMRDFVRTYSDRSGHDHFFSTFDRFEAAQNHHDGEMLALARRQGGDHGVLYLELMVSPNLGDILRASKDIKLENTDQQSLEHTRKAYAAKLNPMLNKISKSLDSWEKKSNSILGCGTAHAEAACKVHVKYLFQAIRIFPLSQVYAELETGYAIAAKDPRFVGLNFVSPEDDHIALRDYKKHMAIFAYMHKHYPHVQLALHAGEVTQSLVHPRELKAHIDDAVHIAAAHRIGHGVDIAHEDNADRTMQDMAQHKVAVEINLTSNDEILGVKGSEHPFHLYRSAGVPLTISTDDEGISRGSMTTEYVRAVLEQNVSYPVLKELSRNGIEYSFAPGKSLWLDKEEGTKAGNCPVKYSQTPNDLCVRFLLQNEKARMQWELEGRFMQFEKTHH